MNGRQVESLCDALCSAFDQDSLDQMLRFHLNKQRANIVASGKFYTVVFELIGVALQQGWHTDLIRAAWESVPNNPSLKKFCADYPELLAPGSNLATGSCPLPVTSKARGLKHPAVSSVVMILLTLVTGLVVLGIANKNKNAGEGANKLGEPKGTGAWQSPVLPPPEGGVVVLAVDPGSPGSVAGLKPGDVIAAVDDQPIKSYETWITLAQQKEMFTVWYWVKNEHTLRQAELKKTGKYKQTKETGIRVSRR